MQSWLRDHFFKGIKERKERERLFLENGSKVLEKLVASCNGKHVPLRTFSAQELCQATNNYCENLVWNWYKGSLEERIVLVKRSLDSIEWADFFIHDMVISAQMCGHSNVLRPIGCCLETQHPILVYEFAANGILSVRIYVSHVTMLQYQPMPWEKRLKIARQIAHVISYLHTAFHRPVIHMTIDMYGILLDEHDVPKLSNFLISVAIPKGETDVEAYEGIRNTRYCTPEFRASGKVREKTDVYKFGGLLLELFTGKDSDVITQLPIYKRLVAYPAQGSCINEIVDPAIMADGKESASLQRQLQAVLDLILICTKEDPQRRPSMVDVTKELRQSESYNEGGDLKFRCLAHIAHIKRSQ